MTKISGAGAALVAVGAATVPPTPAPSLNTARPAMSGPGRRRTPKTAAGARAQYEAEGQRRERPTLPPQRTKQSGTQTHRTGSRLGVLFRTAGQVARTIERTGRGHFTLSQELNWSNRMIDRHQRR